MFNRFLHRWKKQEDILPLHVPRVRYGDLVQISVSSHDSIRYFLSCTDGGDVCAKSTGSLFRVVGDGNILHSEEGFYLETEGGLPIRLHMRSGSLLWHNESMEQAIRVKFRVLCDSTLVYYNTAFQLSIQHEHEPLLVTFSSQDFYSMTSWISTPIHPGRLQMFTFEQNHRTENM